MNDAISSRIGYIERQIKRENWWRRIAIAGFAAFTLCAILLSAFAPDAFWSTMSVIVVTIVAASLAAVAGSRPELKIKMLDPDLEATAVGTRAVNELTKLAILRQSQRRGTQRILIGVAALFGILAVGLPVFFPGVGLLPSGIAVVTSTLFLLPALGIRRFRIKILGQAIEAKGNGKSKGR